MAVRLFARCSTATIKDWQSRCARLTKRGGRAASIRNPGNIEGFAGEVGAAQYAGLLYLRD